MPKHTYINPAVTHQHTQLPIIALAGYDGATLPDLESERGFRLDEFVDSWEQWVLRKELLAVVRKVVRKGGKP